MEPTVYFLYTLGCPLGFIFLIIIFSSVFTHQKKRDCTRETSPEKNSEAPLIGGPTLVVYKPKANQAE